MKVDSAQMLKAAQPFLLDVVTRRSIDETLIKCDHKLSIKCKICLFFLYKTFACISICAYFSVAVIQFLYFSRSSVDAMLNNAIMLSFQEKEKEMRNDDNVAALINSKRSVCLSLCAQTKFIVWRDRRA